MNPDLQEWIWRAAIGLAVALILYAVKDYRKDRIENDLAEETQQPKVKKVGIEVLEAQILAMSSAWDQERASKDRRIEELLQRLRECDRTLEDKKAQLSAAEQTIREMRDQARDMQERLERFQRQLEQLTQLVEPDEEKP